MSKFSDISNQKALSLLEAYKQSNSKEILGKLYAPFMEMVLTIGLKYFKDLQKAEDLVIDVFEILNRKAKDHEVSNFSSWLYSIAKNECLMELRKKKREFPTDDFSYREHFVENTEMMHLFSENGKDQKIKNLENCIDKLKQEQRLCIEKFYLNNKSYKEIVEETDFEMSKVKSHIQNGKRNLKICLEENEK